MKYVLAFLLASTSAAFSGEIDFSTTITDIDGKPAFPCTAEKPECKEPISLASVSLTALLSPDDSREQTSAEEKAKRFSLAVKIHKAGKVDLSAEDVVMTKKAIGRLYGPLVVGRAYELLDPHPKQEAEKRP